MAFDYTLSPDVLLYRSVRTRENLLGGWYCFIPEHTLGYGPITGEFKSNRPLKLLDITTNNFYNDFTGKIVEYSRSMPEVISRKMYILFPLGFTDINVYKKFADEIHIPREANIHLGLELDSQYYGNRSRCSVLEYDLELIVVLKKLYPEYDGIIAPVDLPDLLRNGYQHSELCVFNKDNITLVKELSIIHKGGEMKTADEIPILGAMSLNNEITRKYVNDMKEIHKSFTADGVPIIGAISFNNESIKKYVNAMKEYRKSMVEKKSYLETADKIPIIGAISLADNEYVKKYVNDMKDFHKTFKPLPKKEIMSAYKEPSKRKTRKGLKHRLQNSLVGL